MRKDLKPLMNMPRSSAASHLKQVAQQKQIPFHYSLAALMPNVALAWAKAYWKNRLGKRHPFQTWKRSNGIFTMPNNCKIAVAADWGTGTDEAHQVALRISEGQPHYTIHLGDVYYVGTEEEINENFFGFEFADSNFEACTWPFGSNGDVVTSGNHEMYARGGPFFDLLLPRVGIKLSDHQEASFLCLENDFWRIIVLDTAYNSIGIPGLEEIWQPDCSLRREQLDWLRDVVQPNKDNRNIILMTHHQYFSSFEQPYPKAAEQLAGIIHRPVLWFWGHEHRMAIYGQYALGKGIEAYGRCIGHGGMPIEINSKIKHPDVPLIYTDNRPYPNDEGLTVGFNGHAELLFGNDKLSVDYLDLKGTSVAFEDWIGFPNGIHSSSLRIGKENPNAKIG